MIDEAKIIEECRKGNRKSQKQLYEHFAGKMLAIAMRYCSGRLEAEDVLQESFIKIFDNISRFRHECSLESWIKRIVINTSLKQNRSKLYLFPALDVDSCTETCYEEETALSQYGFSELLAMIQRLAPRYKIVFNLYAIEGYLHKEIAEMLSISEGTSKSQYARAREILKDMLIAENSSAEIR